MASEIRIIIGLGNPDRKYAATRHNAGAMVLECLARHLGLTLTEKLSGSEIARAPLEQMMPLIEGLPAFRNPDIELFLVRPQSYMNLSGKPVARMLQHLHARPQELLVLHDEIDLPFGEIRFKQAGGHRGHNGLRNIIELIGADFNRLRFGVGHPGQRDLVTEYVLSAFSQAEQRRLPDLLESARNMCFAWLGGSIGVPAGSGS